MLRACVYPGWPRGRGAPAARRASTKSARVQMGGSTWRRRPRAPRATRTAASVCERRPPGARGRAAASLGALRDPGGSSAGTRRAPSPCSIRCPDRGGAGRRGHRRRCVCPTRRRGFALGAPELCRWAAAASRDALRGGVDTRPASSRGSPSGGRASVLRTCPQGREPFHGVPHISECCPRFYAERVGRGRSPGLKGPGG